MHQRRTESAGWFEKVSHIVPSSLKATALLRIFGLLKVPMLFAVAPSVESITDEVCTVRIPLRRRTKNHVGSMYFGVLAMGADCAGGLIAMQVIRAEGNSVSLIFKDFHAEFLKRAEGDVLFTCAGGAEIRSLVKRAMESGERENLPVQVIATVPSLLGHEPVARFTLTLSLKRKKDERVETKFSGK